MDIKSVVVDGLLTRYARSGKGKTILMLHGWGDSLSTFQGLAKELSKEYEVIIPDLPGFGQTQAPPSGWGLSDYANFVESFLAKLEVKHVYAISGHSNGGAIAIRLLSHKPLAERLVLLASAGIRHRQNARKQLLKAGAKTAKILTVPLPKAARQRLRNRLYGAIGSDLTVVTHMEETFKRIVGEDVSDFAGRVSQPTLLIYGSSDNATPPELGERLASLLPNSRLEVIKGAGHFIHHEQAPHVTKLIEEFLQ